MGLCLFRGFVALLRHPALLGKLDPSDQAFLSHAWELGSVAEEVRRDDEMIAALGTGSLLGEMSYVSGQPAT